MTRDVLCTYAPVEIARDHPGAVEITTPLDDERAYVRATIWRLSIAVAGILVMNLMLSLGFGTLWLGRPIRKLVGRAHAVGLGDFESRLALRGRDELTDLANEVDRMSANLAAARDALQAEHRAHVAAETQLRHAERLATVGRLAAGIAHEIGTPLNVADGHAKMIAARQVQGSDAAKSAEIITRQTERITDMLRRLMRFARRKQPHKEPVELRQLAHDTRSLLQSLAKKSDITLTVQPGPPVEAFADGEQIQQVLANLVTNAVHAMPDGGHISIDVKPVSGRPPGAAGPDHDYGCLVVADQGAGIAEDHLPHIFDPFFTTKDVNKGTGLGLSIVHGIVRDHNGWVDMQSELGKGSRFFVYLPGAEV